MQLLVLKSLEKEEDNMRHAIQDKRSREIERRRDLESVARRREEKMLKLQLDNAERELLGQLIFILVLVHRQYCHWINKGT